MLSAMDLPCFFATILHPPDSWRVERQGKLCPFSSSSLLVKTYTSRHAFSRNSTRLSFVDVFGCRTCRRIQGGRCLAHMANRSFWLHMSENLSQLLPDDFLECWAPFCFFPSQALELGTARLVLGHLSDEGGKGVSRAALCRKGFWTVQSMQRFAAELGTWSKRC